MKKAILCSLGLFALMSINAQTPELAPGQMPPTAPAQERHPEFIQFTATVHDFGNIRQGVPASHTFTFKNVGNADITLVNVAASCGCTVPNWKGGIYKPGETATITATYNAANEGQFNKTITVTTSEGVNVLTITGNVMNQTAFTQWSAKKHIDDSIANANKPVEKGSKKKKKEKKEKKEKKSKKSKNKETADKNKEIEQTPEQSK